MIYLEHYSHGAKQQSLTIRCNEFITYIICVHRHDIAAIILKQALNTNYSLNQSINHAINQSTNRLCSYFVILFLSRTVWQDNQKDTTYHSHSCIIKGTKDIKGVINSRQAKRHRQYNGRNKKDKTKHNCQQSMRQKPTD